MKIGDKVVITEACGCFYSVGDTAVVESTSAFEGAWLNFNGLGNKEVYGDGVWHASPHRFEVLP